MLEVVFLSPQKTIFEGKAKTIIFPGEKGACEILPFHKNFLTRMLSGFVIIGKDTYPVKRGVVKVDRNRVTIIAEQAEAE